MQILQRKITFYYIFALINFLTSSSYAALYTHAYVCTVAKEYDDDDKAMTFLMIMMMMISKPNESFLSWKK